MRRFAVALGLVGCWSSLALASCATYDDDLIRGQGAFEQSEHERALAIFRALERDTGRLSVVGRAHYAYLRGMTDYRIGYGVEARHWLALAAAMDREIPGSLPPEWKKRMSDALHELNEEMYNAGTASLSGPPSGAGRPSADVQAIDAAPASDTIVPTGSGN